MKIIQNALFRSCAARFGQIAFWSLKVLKIVTRAINSLENEKTVRLPWKWYKTLFSGHAQHVLAKSHFWASNFQNRHTGLKFSRNLENSALSTKIAENPLFRSCAARFRQIWCFERQISQIRETGLKFSSKRKNSALSMKIVQNALFRSCAARFGQIAFLSVKGFKIVKLVWNCLQSGKTVRFARKLYKTRFSGRAQHVLAKSDFLAPNFSNSWNWPQILLKAEKQCAFHENGTKRSFQVMHSTFWPNRILERQSSQERHAGLKFSPKRENSAPSMKIVQDALFRSCAARFGQIALLSVKVLKIVTRAWNSLANEKTVRLPWKLYKTLISGHAQHVSANSHFWASKFSKSWNWPEILFKTEKQCALEENCTKPAFQVMRSTFWPNLIFERQSSQIGV